MTTFVVNGKEEVLSYMVDGIDISGDFIGNTSHGMEIDEDGHYIASDEDLEWWGETIEKHENTNALILKYKEQFDSQEVAKVVQDCDWCDIELWPSQVADKLTEVFGEI